MSPVSSLTSWVQCLFYYTFATPKTGNRAGSCVYFLILSPPPKPETGQGPVLILLYIRHPLNRKLGRVLFLFYCTFATPKAGNRAGSCAYFIKHLPPPKPEIGQGPVFILLYIRHPPNRKLGRVLCLFYYTFATPPAGNWAGSCVFLLYICNPQNRKLRRVLCLF